MAERIFLVRNAIAAFLKTAGTLAGANVSRARTWPVKPEAMPYILVFTDAEDQTNKGHTAAPTFLCAPTIDIEIGVYGDDPEAIEDDIDALRWQVIDAVMTNATIIAMVERVASIRTAFERHEEQYQYHRARITFTFEYTENYEPVLPNVLSLIDAQITGPKGDTVAEIRFTPS